MKPIIPFALLGALLATGANAATTDPVGYYTYDGKAGGNLFVPGFVDPADFSGVITGSTATTMTVAASSLTAGAFDAGAVYATSYVEITTGPNEGVALDILSNTDSVITLATDISGLSLVGDESITIRSHVTLDEALQNAEPSYTGFADSATFYNPDGSLVTYFYDGAGNWSSDFVNPDGNDRPVKPGTGFVLGLNTDVPIVVVGEVKEGPTVVQLSSAGVNIVGPVNPLEGDSAPIVDLGFASMIPFADSLTAYAPGSLAIGTTYFADGAGNVTSDFINPTLDTFPFTLGAVVTASADSALTIDSGVTIAP